MIKVEGLTKKYGNFLAVNNVSFTIKKGEIVGLLGPNGAGKSTIMRILTGFLPATEGYVQIDGYDLDDDSLQIQKRVGFLPENNPLYEDMVVYNYLKYSGLMQGVNKKEIEDRIKYVVKVCGLKEKIGEYIKNLSKGYKQRVGLAQAFIADPQILILDEPTTGLDPNQIVEIRELIKELGKERTLIISSHILSEVEATCNRVLILNKGEIVGKGTPAELRAHNMGAVKIHIELEQGKNGFVEFLKNFPGIVKVTVLPTSSSNTEKYEISVQSEHDIRKDLIKQILDKNFPLLDLHKIDLRLEDIFRELTSNK